jgi:hypothetical protein
MKQYGIDVVQQMEKMLVDHLTESISKDIIRNIFNGSTCGKTNSKSYKRKGKISNILEKNGKPFNMC